jgi:hypothetical protein
MASAFDFLTVAGFLGILLVYLQYTHRDMRALTQLMIPIIGLAVSNQIGNAGQPAFALILIVASAGYVCLVLKKWA